MVVCIKLSSIIKFLTNPKNRKLNKLIINHRVIGYSEVNHSSDYLGKIYCGRKPIDTLLTRSRFGCRKI